MEQATLTFSITNMTLSDAHYEVESVQIGCTNYTPVGLTLPQLLEQMRQEGWSLKNVFVSSQGKGGRTAYYYTRPIQTV